MSKKERLSPQQKRRQRHRQERRAEKARIEENLHKDAATRHPRTAEQIFYEERLKHLRRWTLVSCVIPGVFCLAVIVAKQAPAFLRWALDALFGQSKGEVWVLLQAEGWGQLPMVPVAIGGIPLLIWAVWYIRLTGVWRFNIFLRGQTYLWLAIVLLLIPLLIMVEEQPLGIFRICQADLSALSRGEVLVYEGKFSQVNFCGGWGVDDSGGVFYEMNNLRYAGEPQIQMVCSVKMGQQAELYVFYGGQANGHDGRRFRVEYLPNTGIALSLEVLPKNDKDASG